MNLGPHASTASTFPTHIHSFLSPIFQGGSGQTLTVMEICGHFIYYLVIACKPLFYLKLYSWSETNCSVIVIVQCRNTLPMIWFLGIYYYSVEVSLAAQDKDNVCIFLTF